MDYLLDTNIIIIYSRENAVARIIEEKYQLFSGAHRLAISVISLGEIDAIVKKLGLGEKRKNKIKEILKGIGEIGLNFKEIVSKYGDIDAFSQGKLESSKGKFSSRNMGKNDIWIAATASVFDLTLVTTDKDFGHLDGTYLGLEYINMEELLKELKEKEQ